MHLLTQHKTACLLTLSPLACHEAACGEPVKRRFNAWSGRRGSNPRQPAWKAGTHKNAGRPLWTHLRSQFTQLLKKIRSNEAGTHRYDGLVEQSRRQVVNAS